MAGLRDAHTDELYRALGEFFVEFSQLMNSIEVVTGFYVAGGRTRERFGRAVLAGREARGTADAFFTLAAELGADIWTDADRQVVKALRREVDDLIATRNRFAHDAWWCFPTRDGKPPAPAVLERWVGTKSGITSNKREITAADLEQATQDAARLGVLVIVLLMYTHERRREVLGEYLVELPSQPAKAAAAPPAPALAVGASRVVQLV